MWQEIEKEEYFNKREGLRPLESFSDPDGILPFGYGRPAMDTVWGVDGNQILKCEMRKESRHDIKWETKYFINR